jgi:hypothetical protein
VRVLLRVLVAVSQKSGDCSMLNMVEAGLPEHVCPESGEWLFVDVGFSSKRRSCGLVCNDDTPKALTFAEARARIIAAAAVPEAANVGNKATLNLLIEAPLSVAFDERGNPTGRIFEKLTEGHRYWNEGGGCLVMTAAMYLLRALHDSKPRRKVRLFEGFVSFKVKGQATSHCEDVETLRAVVLNRTRPTRMVLAPNELASNRSDTVLSAFAVAGMNFGVPSVIRTSA